MELLEDELPDYDLERDAADTIFIDRFYNEFLPEFDSLQTRSLICNTFGTIEKFLAIAKYVTDKNTMFYTVRRTYFSEIIAFVLKDTSTMSESPERIDPNNLKGGPLPIIQEYQMGLSPVHANDVYGVNVIAKHLVNSIINDAEQNIMQNSLIDIGLLLL